jgi:hypothetical protein
MIALAAVDLDLVADRPRNRCPGKERRLTWLIKNCVLSRAQERRTRGLIPTERRRPPGAGLAARIYTPDAPPQGSGGQLSDRRGSPVDGRHSIDRGRERRGSRKLNVITDGTGDTVPGQDWASARRSAGCQTTRSRRSSRGRGEAKRSHSKREHEDEQRNQTDRKLLAATHRGPPGFCRLCPR